MSLAERNIGLLDDLDFALDQAQAGNYAEALRLVGRARLVDPRNIFIIALEKQLSRLRGGGILPREKVEIMQSLSGLVDRARVDGERRGLARPPADRPPTAAVDEKTAKLRLVVEQYFQHADDWMAREDYDGASKEIERVLLIEPGNARAKEYQSRIEQARQARRFREAKEAPAPPVPTASPAAPVAVSPATATPKSVEVTPAPEEGKKKSSLALLLVIGCIVVAVGVAVFVFLPSKRNGSAADRESPGPAPVEQAISTAPREIPPDTPVEAPEVVVPTAPRVEREKKGETSRPAEKAAEQPREIPAPGLVNASPTAVSGSLGKAEAPATTTQFIPVQKEPKILRLDQPSFSDADLGAGIKGEIVVKVQIDKSGRPLQAKVVSSTNPLLNDPVVDAVMKSTYSPGIMSNGPVMSWMTIPFRFK